MKIYIAASWKKSLIVKMVKEILLGLKQDVFDFTENGFNWPDYDAGESKIGPQKCFEMDDKALRAADAVIAIVPAGFSTGVELGIANEMKKEILVLNLDPDNFKEVQLEQYHVVAVEVVDYGRKIIDLGKIIGVFIQDCWIKAGSAS